MIGIHTQNVAPTRPAQSHFQFPDAIDAVASHPSERHIGRRQPLRLFSPGFRQIQSPVDKSVPLGRDIGCEHANLAIRDLARGPGILPSHPAGGRALFEEPGLVDHKHRVGIAQMLDDMIAHHVTQRIRLPAATPKQSLLPPRPRIASTLARIHPVLRGSLPSRVSRKRPADAATRS